MQLANIRKLTHNKHILQYVLKRNRMQRGGKGKDQLVSPKYPEEIYVSCEDGKYIMEGEKLDNGDYMYSLATKNRTLHRFVKEQTEEICKLAVQQDGIALQFVKEQTEEICKLAVQQNGHALKYVSTSFQTEEI